MTAASGHRDPAGLRRRGALVAPLSSAQESLWFVEQAHPGTAAYCVPVVLRWHEPVQVRALAKALCRLSVRHESLRTTYELRGGQPVQVIGEARSVPLVVHHQPTRPTAAELTARVRRPFDLARGPVLRCELWQSAPEGDTLLIAVHHIACDGWSLSTVLDDLSAAYEAAVAHSAHRTAAAPLQYADFAVWERESAQHRDVDGRAAQRAEVLADVGASPLFPGRGRTAEAVRPGGHLAFTVPAGLWERTCALAIRMRATPFVVLLTAFQEVLRRWSGSDDFLVGTVMANRQKSALEHVVGNFVNVVPLRCMPRAGMTFTELCRQTRAESFQAMAYQDIPFDRLTALSAAKRGTGREPLVEVAFGLQNMPAHRGHRRWREPELLPTGMARYDLLFLIEDRAGGVTGTIEYDRTRCTLQMAEQFRDNFVVLLTAAVTAPDSRLAALPLSTSRSGVLTGPRRDLGRVRPPADRTLLDQVAARLAEDPAATAVSTAGVRLSRGELDAWSWAVAAGLDAASAGPVVPVLAARGPGLVAGWLGTLRSGRAFLPLGLDTPAERLEYVLTDQDARFVLADEAGAATLRQMRAAVRVLDLAALRDGPMGTRRMPALTGDDTAAVIYTSGTTGRPKGVPVPHRGLANTVLWWVADADLGPDDRLLCVVSTSFDPATFETFRALVSGAELIYADDVARKDPRALLQLLHASTVVAMTPGLMRAVLDVADDTAGDGRRAGAVPASSSLRLIYLGGAKLPRALAVECADRWQVPLRNVYGPTEVSCTSVSAPVDPADPKEPPIGSPVWNTRAYVLGPDGEELPRGVPGELHLAGAGVSAGYTGRSRTDHEAFRPDPFAPADEPGALMYRTGDRVVVRRDGLLCFLGRVDEQVKILGHRIEPAEVAALLEEHDSVLSAAVTAEAEPRRLVAYVVPARAAALPTHDELIRPLGRWLPAVAFPREVYVVDALPRTGSDKTDFAMLRALRDKPLARAGRPPADLDPDQRWASEQFRSALDADGRPRAGQHEELSPDDDFFALGGHSLLAVRMLAGIERADGVTVPLRDFLDQPTVARLARLRTEAIAGPVAIHAAPPDGRYPATAMQQNMVFLDRLAGQRAAYVAPTAVELTGPVDRDALRRALAHVVGHHPALRSRFSLDRDRRQVFYRTDGTPPEVEVTRWADRARFTEHLREFCWRPFDLARDAPARAEVAVIGESTVLVLVSHHAAIDGWAQRILMRQLGIAYHAVRSGRTPELPAAVHPGMLADAWTTLHEPRRAERAEALLARLRGAPTDIALPHDRPRSPARPTAAGRRVTRLAPGATAGLRQALAAEGATASMAGPALLAAALAETAGQRDFLFAFPWAGRDTAAATEAVAMLIRTLVLRVDLRAGPTWRELLAAVREESLTAYRYADVPFETLVADLDPARGLRRPPVTPVLVTTATEPPAVPDLGPDVRARHVAPPGLCVKYELELTLTDTGGDIDFELAYATALFDGPTVDALLGRLTRAAGRLADDPDARVLPPVVARDDRPKYDRGTGQKTGEARP